jgi:hypothetical protein
MPEVESTDHQLPDDGRGVVVVTGVAAFIALFVLVPACFLLFAVAPGYLGQAGYDCVIDASCKVDRFSPDALSRGSTWLRGWGARLVGGVALGAGLALSSWAVAALHELATRTHERPWWVWALALAWFVADTLAVGALG